MLFSKLICGFLSFKFIFRSEFIISNKEFAWDFTVNVIKYLEAIAFTSDLLT